MEPTLHTKRALSVTVISALALASPALAALDPSHPSYPWQTDQSIVAVMLEPQFQQPRVSDAQEEYKRALMYLKGDGVPTDEAFAFTLMQLAAKQGLPEAQVGLGWMYENGTGVAQDETEAVKWFRKSAEQGWAPGQYDLGVAYMRGAGITQDYANAVKWFQKAAAQGHATAQFNLGIAYIKGTGVPKDEAEAVKWLRMAVKNGDPNAPNALRALGLNPD